MEQVGVNDDNGDALGNDNGDDDNASENAEDYDKAADVSRAMLERTRYRFFFFLFFHSSLASRSMQLAHPPKNKKNKHQNNTMYHNQPLHKKNQKKTARH